MSRGRSANAAFFRQHSQAVSDGGGCSNAVVSRIARSRETGALNLADLGISSLPDLLDLERYPVDKFWETSTLTKLDASFNILEYFPDYDCYNELTSINLRGNQYQNMDFSSIPLVQVLDLQANSLLMLNDSIGCLQRLKVLQLADNRLDHIPDSITECICLQEINLSNNSLVELPEGLGRLTSLRQLIVSENRILHLPNSVSNLRSLETLDVSKNRLSSIPNMSGLVSMTSLKAMENGISELPTLPIKGRLATLQLGYNRLNSILMENILGCYQSLAELHLNNNKLSSIPHDIGRLSQLKVLDISNNDVTELPACLGYLTHLHRIVLDGNPIRSIRRSLLGKSTDELKAYLRTRGPPHSHDSSQNDEAEDVQTIALRRARASVAGCLNLSGLDLVAFPSDLFRSLGHEYSGQLHSFDLSKNKLSSFPSELSLFAALKSLNLSRNSLGSTNLESIKRASLPLLTTLDISGNALTTHNLKSILRSLRNNASYSQHPLTCLIASMNAVTDVPTELMLHSSIREIQLADNKIASLSNIDFRQLPKLEIIILDHNILEDIESLRDASNLRTLSIENNELQVVPAFLGLMPNLTSLCVHGNPQRSIPAHVIEQGTAAILKILRNRLPIDRLGCYSDIENKSANHRSRSSFSEVENRSGAVAFGSLESNSQPKTRSLGAYIDYKGNTHEIPANQTLECDTHSGPRMDAYSKIQEMERIRAEIEALEAEEESFSISEKRRASIRKELQKKRAIASGFIESRL